jgi:hypothetical protein
MRRLLKFSPRSAIALLWILLTLYPNPLLLARSIGHAINPPVDPVAVKAWADELPSDPAYIEQQVLDRFVPYAVPWQSFGVPWYYPTTSEVVAMGKGDCQARMLVLASILKAKGIPYRLEASLDHIWVDYPGKQSNELENGELALLQDGKLQLPERWDWQQSYRIEKDYFWDTMPLERKLLLFGGLLLILLWRVGAGRIVSWMAPTPSPSPNSRGGE